jgi:hypothetical protein
VAVVQCKCAAPLLSIACVVSLVRFRFAPLRSLRTRITSRRVAFALLRYSRRVHLFRRAARFPFAMHQSKPLSLAVWAVLAMSAVVVVVVAVAVALWSRSLLTAAPTRTAFRSLLAPPLLFVSFVARSLNSPFS